MQCTFPDLRCGQAFSFLEDFGDDSHKLSFCYVTQILHIKPLNFQPINKVMVSKISQKGMQETEVPSNRNCLLKLAMHAI